MPLLASNGASPHDTMLHWAACFGHVEVGREGGVGRCDSMGGREGGREGREGREGGKEGSLSWLLMGPVLTIQCCTGRRVWGMSR